ncbi:MAG TPA: MFS transporter [Ktedonobacterales bacterium]|nr:MFS transporter [Ktedonobacterales bacterium]
MTLETQETRPAIEDATYRRLFALRGFPRLAIGSLLGRMAGEMWQIVLVLFVLQRFHSPALAGLAAFLSLFPGLVLTPLAGALLDRHGRVRLILIDFSMAAVALTTIAVLSRTELLTPPLLLVIVAVTSLTAPLSFSGIRTLFPLVVPSALWDRANAVDTATGSLAMVGGPALAGFLVAGFGGEGAFLCTAGLFVLSGLVTMRVRDPQTRSAATQESLLRSAWQALVYVVRNPTLRGVVVTFWMTNVPSGFLIVALPVLVLRQFHWGAQGVGALWSVAGIATVVAGFVFGSIDTRGHERQLIASGMVLAALACLLDVTQMPAVVVAAMALFGLAWGPINIGLFALRQRRTDPRWFGRVFAVSMGLNIAGLPVGSALAGPVVERSVTLALIVAAVIAVVGCVTPFLLIPRER